MKKRKHSGRSSNQSANNSDGDVQVAGEASAAPPREQVSAKLIPPQSKGLLKEGCLDDANQRMDQSVLHASHSSIPSFAARDEDSFEERKRKLLSYVDLIVEKKKAIASSGDLGKIAQDEDEHSDNKRPSSGDLGKMIALDEDEQHSDKIGVHAIEDHKQEQGGAPDYVQALLNMDADTLSEKASYYFKQLKLASREYPDCLPFYEPHQLTEVYEQLALYRITGYELSVDRQLDELDDANLKRHYPPHVLYEQGVSTKIGIVTTQLFIPMSRTWHMSSTV